MQERLTIVGDSAAKINKTGLNLGHFLLIRPIFAQRPHLGKSQSRKGLQMKVRVRAWPLLDRPGESPAAPRPEVVPPQHPIRVGDTETAFIDHLGDPDQLRKQDLLHVV